MPEVITKKSTSLKHEKFVPTTRKAKKIHALREKMKQSKTKLLSRKILDKVHYEIKY